MKRIFVMIVGWTCLLAFPGGIRAQVESGGDDNPNITTNLGIPLSIPLNPTSRFVSAGWGLDAGIGYNFNRRNAVIGEFMWNSLYPTNEALQPIRVALQSPNISGHGNLLAVTANYRLELRGRVLGTYLIGGGGWYFREASLSKPVPVGTSITCDRTWLWWGYNCQSGTVITNLTLASSSSNSWGVNGGIGFTARVGEAPYRFYVESRYHYAPTRNISTQLVAITIGIRY